MLRAIAVTAATVAGLSVTLGYAPVAEPDATASGDDVGPGTAGLLAPPPIAAPGPASPAPTTASPTASAPAASSPSSPASTAPDADGPSTSPGATTARGPAAPRGSSASTAPSRSGATAPPRTPSPTRTPPPSPRPSSSAPTPSASPAPTTSPTDAEPEVPTVDHTGPPVSHVHGTVQVAVRVRGDVIVDAWAVQYPSTGEALAINQEAIPRLRARTIAAQSAGFATVSGATLTSNAWKESLQAALLEAGW